MTNAIDVLKYCHMCLRLFKNKNNNGFYTLHHCATVKLCYQHYPVLRLNMNSFPFLHLVSLQCWMSFLLNAMSFYA